MGVIECAILIPFVLFFTLNCIEFSRAFSANLQLTSVVRELSIAAFRQCANRSDDQIGSCLRDILGQAGPNARERLPGSGIILSVYKWRPAAGASAPFHIYLAALEADQAAAEESRYSVAAFGDDSLEPPPAGTPARTLFDHGTMLMAELRYTYTPLIPFLTDGIGYFVGGREFYAAAVL